MSGQDSRINILMIDDDTKLCRLVTDYLAPFGFDVTSVNTGTDGITAASGRQYAAILLDVMLPGIDGFEVLRQIRAVSSVPILMLTSLGDEADRIIGLENGADDYLPKTFSTREVLARLRAVTRRSQLNAASLNDTDQISSGDLELNAATRIARQNGKRLELTSLEFDLLHCLLRSSGRVLNRDQILDEIAGRDYDAFDRSIDVHISSLRKKLGDDFKSPRYIRTFRRVGYMFVGDGGDD